MNLVSFNAEISTRLEEMRSQQRPLNLVWPEGCYGSARSILVFVGPSPGGSPLIECGTWQRNPSDGLALWNETFSEPFDDSRDRWGGKYVYSIPIFLETIIGVSLQHGAKLYAFANFDWIQCPREVNVSTERMKSGEREVLHVLSSCKPLVIVPLTRGAASRLRNLLEKNYNVVSPHRCDVLIDIGKSRRFHRDLEVYQLKGSGVLNGAVVIRSPQHPNRVLNREHAMRCAKAIRHAFMQMLEGRDTITIQEVDAPPSQPVETVLPQFRGHP